MIYYFAYGSNLHPVRLMKRVPSAKLIGNVSLKEHLVTFHKKSKDGSSKCNLLNTGDMSDVVHGALYQIAAEHKGDLDKYESKGFGYMDAEISIEHAGEQYECFTYIAQEPYIVDGLKPYGWYKELVLLGARYLGFPEDYISAIACVESVDDPDPSRSVEHRKLIEDVRSFGGEPLAGMENRTVFPMI